MKATTHPQKPFKRPTPMNKIVNIVILSTVASISRANAESITMTCYPTGSPSYNVTWNLEGGYTKIDSAWSRANAPSRKYKVLEKDSKGNVIYLRTQAKGQTRTVYLAHLDTRQLARM